jgi:predicted  nucleic acid-binding Zn-ribbon protein
MGGVMIDIIIKQNEIISELADRVSELEGDQLAYNILSDQNEALRDKLKKAHESWDKMDKELNAKIEELDNENQGLLEAGFGLNDKMVKLEDKADYYRKKLRRLEDRIKREMKRSDFLWAVWQDYKEAERRRK